MTPDRPNAGSPADPSPPAEARPTRTGDLSIDRIATVPNLLSAIRIAMIPVFVALLLHHGTEEAGLLLLGFTLATDWVDGFIARRTGQVSNLGKMLDPLADRLAIAAGLVTVVVRGAFPLWAALAILVRDAIVLVGGIIVSARWRIRLDVRWIGKAGTFGLMIAVPAISWASFGLPGADAFRVLGWVSFWGGIPLYYAAAAVYAVDVRNAIGGVVRPR